MNSFVYLIFQKKDLGQEQQKSANPMGKLRRN